MKTAICNLEGAAPYSQSRVLRTPKNNRENSEDYEKRVWRDRIHSDSDGNTFIPPMAFKRSIESAARYLSEQIPGKGKATYTKHFLSGILVQEGLPLNIKKDDVTGKWYFLSSTGKKGSEGGTMVWKCYPEFHKWKGDVTFYVTDDTIPEDVFERFLTEAGRLIGIGRFRPQNGGFFGTYKVNSVTWI